VVVVVVLEVEEVVEVVVVIAGDRWWCASDHGDHDSGKSGGGGGEITIGADFVCLSGVSHPMLGRGAHNTPTFYVYVNHRSISSCLQRVNTQQAACRRWQGARERAKYLSERVPQQAPQRKGKEGTSVARKSSSKKRKWRR
jgi:hypothetical protein